jgi:carboxyl-terminal processing protease
MRFLGAALLATGLAANAQVTSPPIRQSTPYEDLQMFGQVLNQLRVNHPDSVDTHTLLIAAIAGMVGAADPHSYVIPAIRLEAGKEQQLRSGALVPVPLSFAYIGGAPVVAAVAAGTAARALDILPGDELVGIEDRPVTAESAEELDIALAGAKRSEVTLQFERRRANGSLARLERRVRRERADEASAVPAAMMLDATTGYVRITTFVGERVADDLHTALERLEREGMSRLVLDLRDNGGGSVSQAARVAGEFLPKGALVYTSEGRKKELTDTGRVQRSFWRGERRYPIVVMTNGGTASASELVAGALQDHDRALLYGRATFGKSLLMRGFPLTDGSLIMMVVGRVRTPCGRVIQREYRSITRREYYRLALAARDTAGRPTCRTDGGRTVYGGGGIYPDVVVPEPDAPPAWYTRVQEDQLVLQWAGGYAGAVTTSLDDHVRSPALAPAALQDFRTFAGTRGVMIPRDTSAEAELGRVLSRAVANAKWGDTGYYRTAAVLDAAVRGAVMQFGMASALLR